jgi:hypothetical protein
MTTYQPASPHSDSIKRPGCFMRLFGIEPERPGYELHSFECPSAGTLKRRSGKVHRWHRKFCLRALLSEAGAIATHSSFRDADIAGSGTEALNKLRLIPGGVDAVIMTWSRFRSISRIACMRNNWKLRG